MDTKNVCRLCLMPKNEIIEFFGAEAITLNITKILEQHFWFQIHQDDNLPIGICHNCWNYVNGFHEFYTNIEIIHKNHYDILQIKKDLNISNIKSEIIVSTVSTNENELDLSSSNHQNIDVIESVIQIKNEDEQILYDKPEHEDREETCFNNSKSTDKFPISNTIKNDNRAKIKRKITTKRNLKKILNKTSSINVKNVKAKQPNIQQSTIENPIIDDDNLITYDVENEDEFDLSNDIVSEIRNNDVTENQECVINKNLMNRNIKDPEDIRIKEFFNLNCEICSSPQSTMSELKKHFLNAHNSKNGYVKCCGKKLINRKQLIQHMLWHSKPTKHKCKECGIIYDSKIKLRQHKCSNKIYVPSSNEKSPNVMLKDMKIREYYNLKCPKCSLHHSTFAILKKHYNKVHNSKNVFVLCCEKRLFTRDELLDHIECHSNPDEFKCSVCYKMNVNEAALKRHLSLKHHPKPKYPKYHCDICGAVFIDKMSLFNHLIKTSKYNQDKFDLGNGNICENIDLKDNPDRREFEEEIKIREFYNLKCEICASQNSTLIELKKHYRNSHNTNYSYVLCCNKKLFYRKQLLEHIRWHTNPDEFRCKVCNRFYANQLNLMHHMDEHLKPEHHKYVCDICSTGFRLKCKFLIHFRRVHLKQYAKFKCNQCAKCFSSNLNLFCHVQNVHKLKKPTNVNKVKVKCNVCGKRTTALQKHMEKLHTDIKNICKICSKIFKNSKRLMEHNRRSYCNSNIYKCTYCSSAYHSKAKMTRHRKIKHTLQWAKDRKRKS